MTYLTESVFRTSSSLELGTFLWVGSDWREVEAASESSIAIVASVLSSLPKPGWERVCKLTLQQLFHCRVALHRKRQITISGSYTYTYSHAQEGGFTF